MSAARRIRVAALLLAGVVAACESLLVDPAPAVPELGVSFQIVEGDRGGPLRAFHRVDRVYLRFSTGDTVKRDTVLPITQDSTGIRVRVVLHTDERVPALGVYAEMRMGEDALFKGLKVVRVEAGVPTQAEVTLSPIPASVRPSLLELEVPAVGDSVQLTSAVLFASGDTIPGIAGEWSSENPAVALVSPAGLMRARAVGQTKLSATYETLVAHVTVVVVAPGR